MSMSISNTLAAVPDRSVSGVKSAYGAALDVGATVASAWAPLAAAQPCVTVSLSKEAVAAAQSAGSAIGDAADAVSQALDDGVKAVGKGVHDVEEAVVDGWHSVENTVDQGYKEVKDGVENAAHAVGQAATSAYEAVANAADQAVSYAAMVGQAISDKV